MEPALLGRAEAAPHRARAGAHAGGAIQGGARAPALAPLPATPRDPRARPPARADAAPAERRAPRGAQVDRLDYYRDMWRLAHDQEFPQEPVAPPPGVSD